MKIFVFTHSPEGERELIGEHDMTQIPRVGDGLMAGDGNDLVTRPILAVHHFILASDNQQGAFLIVGEAQMVEQDSAISRLFTR